MRKLTILLGLAVLTASNAGCCCGRIRNWFHKGSPCGTAVAPAVLGAPLAMGTPMMSAPMSQPIMSAPMMSAPICVEAPQCVMPCDPCADPCATGQVVGYGGMMGCDCNGGMGATLAPTAGTIVMPGPLGD
jgi:hypothetical protein